MLGTAQLTSFTLKEAAGNEEQLSGAVCAQRLCRAAPLWEVSIIAAVVFLRNCFP